MAENPITISSSDSDDAPAKILSDSDSDSDLNWDLDDYRAIESPPKEAASESRVLPSWASANGATSSGSAGPSERVSPKRAFASNGSTSSSNYQAEARFQTRPSYNGDVGTSNWRTTRENVNEQLSSQQASKRTLPTSLQPSLPWVENISSSQMRDSHGKSYDPAWSNAAHSQYYTNDHFGGARNDVVIMHENSKNRMLPPSLMHGKSVSTAQYAGYSDPLHRSVLGDERAATSDERLIYQAAVQNLYQPKGEVTLPEGLLSVPLLRHQKIALNWMLKRETTMQTCLGGILADDQGLGKTVSMIALIQMQKSLQSKAENQHSQETEALNLDDDEENGSSVPDKGKDAVESSNSKLIPEEATTIPEFRKRRPAAGTLVVCPASVLRQWARELDEKVADGAKLSILVYHGGNRTKIPEQLANHDVVVTTYAIVANEVPKQQLVDEDEDDQKNGDRYGLSSEFSANKRKKTSVAGKKGKKGKKGMDSSAIAAGCGPLAKVNWLRVVLDEAQTIKNHRTQVARACCGLRAKTRWCLSGTPIQNAIDELYSYFRFLKYDPYADYKSFCLSIKFPISRNSDHGYKKLQVVLRNIMLRRTKGTLIDGKPIISLPPKTVHMARVDFSAEERAFYLKLEADSRSKFKAYAAAGTVNQNYANILLMLLRLRQACDHPLLVKGFISDHVGIDSSKTAKKLPRDLLISLYKHFETSLAICPLCIDPPEDAVVTMCGHVFCYQCVSEYLTGDDNTCPAPKCGKQLNTDNVFSKATLMSCISEDSDSDSLSLSQFPEKSNSLQNEYGSAKIRAVLDILQSHHKSKTYSSEMSNSAQCDTNSPSMEIECLGSFHSGVTAVNHTAEYLNSETEGPIKTIVFSQWTSMLDLVGISLKQSHIQFRRLDGSMTLASRDRAVKEFNTDPEVTVMLMSLKAGNLGLNMVAACHVILLDLWWNPTTEDQAIDRAHRIGQTRPVTVSRLTVKDTVEDRILSLQEEKRKMVASAFGEDQTGGSATRLTLEDLNYLFLGRT